MSTVKVAGSVLIFLGVPLVAGFVGRRLAERLRSRRWYEDRYLPKVGPFALYGLLFTIVILFAFQGDRIIGRPSDVARIAVPLVIYFVVMWLVGQLLGLVYLSLALRRRYRRRSSADDQQLDRRAALSAQQNEGQ